MDFLQQAVERAKSQHEVPVRIVHTETNDSVRTSERVQPQQIEYRVTRRVPASPRHLHEKRILNPMSDAGTVAAYKLLRTQILHKMTHNNFNSLAVVSANQAEGKTLTAVNLAISMAQEVNHTVLLVDFDLAKPSVHEQFGFEPQCGIGDYLAGRVELSAALVNPDIERLVVLPGREALTNTSELLSSPDVVSLINDIKSRYRNRIIVFDLPSVLHQDDALALSPHIDALLIVVAEGETQDRDLVRTAQLVGNKPVLGTVLNKSTTGKRSGAKRQSWWRRG